MAWKRLVLALAVAVAGLPIAAMTQANATPASTAGASRAASPPSGLNYARARSRLIRPGVTIAELFAAQIDSQSQDHALLVIRNHKGQRVFRGTFAPTCEDQEGGCDLEYRFRWDGRSNGGVLQPSRVYRVYGYFVDTSGRTLKAGLGGFSIQHLVTKTALTGRDFPQQSQLHQSAYDVVGACSDFAFDSSTGVWLRSLQVSCPSPQPGDDVVDLGLQFPTFGPLTVPAGLGFSRLVKLRFEVYGEAGSPGDTMTVGIQNAPGRTANTFVNLPGTISGGVGWHPLGWYTVDPAVLGGRTEPAYRLQVNGGSTYHVRFMRVTYVIRAWVTG